MSLYSFKQFTYGTNTVIAHLGDFVSAKINFDFDYPKQGVNYAGMVSSPLIEVGAFLDDVEIPDARFVIPTRKDDDVKNDNVPSFSGMSLLWLFSKAIVYSSGGSITIATDQVFNTSTPGGIFKTLCTQNTARGGICAAFTFTSFTNTTDSNGVAWANTIGNITYEVGTNYLAILRNLVDNGLCEVKLVGRDFRMYNPGTMGTDRTTSNPPVVFFEGRDVAEAPYTTTSEGVAGVNLIKGDNAILAQAVNAGTNTTYGRWENYISQGGVADTTTLSVIAQAELQRTSGQRTELTHKLAVDANGPQPLVAFFVSDWVYSNTAGTNNRYRLRQLVMEIDSNGVRDASVVLNDKFLESDIITARKVNGILGGATVTGSIGTPGSDPSSDTTIPSAPASLTLTSATMVDTGGIIRAQVTASWPAVTTNTDSSTISDLDRYEVQFETDVITASTKPGVWTQSAVVPSGTVTTFFGPVSPNTVIRGRVRAVDSNAHASTWTQSVDITTAADTTPPNAPSTPQVSAFFRGIRVIWDGLDNVGGVMPGDFDHLDVHMSTTSAFTPSSATFVDQLKTRGGVSPLLNLTYGTTYFVKLVAYDTTGNASTPSAQASSAPSQLSDPDLPANLVQGAKIALNTIAVKNLTVGTFTENLLPNGNMEDTSANSRPSFWENVGTVVGGGSLSIMSTDSTSQINGPNSMKVVPTATVACEFLSSNLPATEGDIYYLSVMVKTSRVLAGGGLVKLMAYTGATSGAFTTTFTVATVAGSTTIFQLEGQVVIPAGHRWITVGLYATTDSVGAYNAFFDDAEMRKVVGTANIANASINNAKIANLAVDDAKIASLAAGKITTGTLAADVILGARIRTASSGARVDISGIGIEMYRSTGFRTGYWNPTNGQLRIYNETDASLSSTGHGLQFGDDTGQNLIIDTNEIMVRNNGSTDNMSLNQYGGSVGMSSTLYSGNPYSINALRAHPDRVYITNPTKIYAGVGTDANDVDVLNEAPPLMIGINSGFHIQFDNNEVQAVDVDHASDFGINRQGGNVNIHINHQFADFGSLPWLWWKPKLNTSSHYDVSILMGNTSATSGIGSIFVRDFTGNNARDLTCRTLTQTSGRDSKTNIVDISDQDLLPVLAGIKVYQYDLLDDPVAPIRGNKEKGITPGPQQIGPMAEDLATLGIPGLVQQMPHTGPAVSVASMQGLLFLAGKQLRKGLVQARQEIVDLKARVAALEAKVGP
jgi:hypothetical protein